MKFYRTFPTPKAITFDLDDTLYNNGPIMRTSEQALRDYMHQHWPQTARLGPADWQQYKLQLLSAHPELASDMGQLRRRTLSAAMTACGVSSKVLAQAVDDCFTFFYHQRSNFKVNETICSLLADLSAKVPLVAITNGNVNLASIGIEPYFSASYHANMQQPMKPHPYMFEQAQALLGLPAEAILHVGDNLEKDVMGARQCGYRTAWYAINRPMLMQHEPARVLPDVQLDQLDELRLLVS